MLESGPAVQAQALDEADALGADVIRANVIWSKFAPSPTSKRKPKGFTGKDPAAYPTGRSTSLTPSSPARRRAGCRCC